MTTTKDRAAGVGPVPTPTPTVTHRATTETDQCRMLRSDESRCPNAALPHADGEAVVCVKHAARVLKLAADHQLAARTRRTK